MQYDPLKDFSFIVYKVTIIENRLLSCDHFFRPKVVQVIIIPHAM